MAEAVSQPRVTVDGKFFRLGTAKFYVKGVSYGPFAPNAAGFPFASPEQTDSDFAQIARLGGNLVRVYHVPGRWFLDLAAKHQLKVLIDIPWNKHICFLDSPEQADLARESVRRTVQACAGHPAVFAFSVVNEIPSEIVRWTGSNRISAFIDELVLEAKRIDPGCLCTFGNFPPTEFLRPREIDFLCVNVYLHHEPAFRNYLARLQMIADAKPLILGEFGIDSVREGEAAKCTMLSWQIEDAFRSGVAGAVVFGFTDDWWKEGKPVTDWQFGLTNVQRQPKDSYHAVQKAYAAAPFFPLPRYPRVSVVVASYNGDRILRACLESLTKLNYPDYEVILVDDGSTDTTLSIISSTPNIRYFRHERNLGLSNARNTGIAAATGDIVAFTDSDCRADPDWLYYMVGALLTGEYAAMGGPNLLPPEDSPVAAAVMASPGGPAHVMVTDREAEHIPGCNMAFWKWALTEIGGFDPIFRAAGDDVDVCWRLQQAGHRIGFSPAALVWHYRRSTVGAYLKQQKGYGEAEAVLTRKHPEYFNSFGGSIWRGRIYTSSKLGVQFRSSIIYRGLFGSAGYQLLYVSDNTSPTLMLGTSLEYHVLITLPLWFVAAAFPPLLPVAITSLLLSLGLCAAAGAQASLPRNRLHWWSRPLVALLFALQPLVRGWARHATRLEWQPPSPGHLQNLESLGLRDSRQRLHEVNYWAEQPIDRLLFVSEILRRLDLQAWPHRADVGWSEHDVEIYASRWVTLQLVTVAEYHQGGRQQLRCRLAPRVSLLSKIAAAAFVASELLLLGFVGARSPWPWALLVLVPIFAWFLRRQARTVQAMLHVFLDRLAEDWKLQKIREEPASKPPAGRGALPTAPPGHPTVEHDGRAGELNGTSAIRVNVRQ